MRGVLIKMYGRAEFFVAGIEDIDLARDYVFENALPVEEIARTYIFEIGDEPVRFPGVYARSISIDHKWAQIGPLGER